MPSHAGTGTNGRDRFADADLYLAVAVGGAIGAFGRHGLDLLILSARDGWPTATFVVNISGAFVLGIVLIIARRAVPDPTASTIARRFRPLIITGVLGGYTTFSTFMVEAHGLVVSDRTPTALLYVFGSLVAGVTAVALGGLVAGLVARLIAGRPPVPILRGSQEVRETTEDEA
ncbi:MAG: fluoride efflux transporter CrcB [Actinomycetes bacterium]